MRPHRLATILCLAVLLAWGGAMAWVLARAAPQDDLLVAVFPPGTSAEEAFRKVIAADGLLVAATWAPNAWLVAVAEDGAVERLRAAGAWWVGAAAPWRFASLGGCGLAIEPAAARTARSLGD